MSKQNFTVRLDDETREWLMKEADQQKRSVANLICWIIREYRNQKGIPGTSG